MEWEFFWSCQIFTIHSWDQWQNVQTLHLWGHGTPTPLTGGMFWGRSDDYSLFSGHPKERRHDEPKDPRSITKHHCWPPLKGRIVGCHLASPSQPKPRLKIILPRIQVLPCFQVRLYQWEELAFGMSQWMEATTLWRSWGPLGPFAGMVSSGPPDAQNFLWAPASVPCLDIGYSVFNFLGIHSSIPLTSEGALCLRKLLFHHHLFLMVPFLKYSFILNTKNLGIYRHLDLLVESDPCQSHTHSPSALKFLRLLQTLPPGCCCGGFSEPIPRTGCGSWGINHLGSNWPSAGDEREMEGE